MEKFVVTVYVEAPDRAHAEEAMANVLGVGCFEDAVIKNWIVDDDENK